MKLKIAVTHLLVLVSTTVLAGEVTSSIFDNKLPIIYAEPIPNDTVIQARPFNTQPIAVVPAAPVIQERPRDTTNRNPNSDRTRIINAKGGDAATQSCGGLVEITDMSGRCNEKEYDKDFLNFLQTEGLACAREAGQAAFGFIPTQIKLRTHEGQVNANRRSSNGKYSTHSAGRALDVFKVEIYNGQAHNEITMHGSYMDRRGHRTFYHGFRDCWKKAIVGERGRSAGTCGSGCLHYGDANHWDHMHISLPPTNSNRSTYGLNCT